METINILRNALVTSGQFDRVQYCGRNQLYLQKDNRVYVLRKDAMDDITGLAALFG